jgi:8-amino-7-oxononanoate synthase
VLDFTSALYLGLRHPSSTVRPWTRLTTGRPAALITPPGEGRVACALAQLQGHEGAVLAPSTLHLMWDLFGALAEERVALFADAEVYPIARWGVERAAARGAPARDFAHFDADDLRRTLAGAITRSSRRPVIVTDGFCPGCGRVAPLDAYVDAMRPYGGRLVIDDTQALGILGQAPAPDAPYGRGGGGTLRWSGVSGPDVLVVSSLAKGFGVPIASLAGSTQALQAFARRSETRVHCSPPSAAVIHAAERALAVNRKSGDQLRRRLARLVGHFRGRFTSRGLAATTDGLFPVQTLTAPVGASAAALHARLLRRGIRTVLLRGHRGGAPRLTFMITASHTVLAIDRGVELLVRAAAAVPRELVRS